MVTLHEVITFLVSMQISISSLQTHNVNRCGRSRHLARKLSRSEERRVGKECRSRWSAYHVRKYHPSPDNSIRPAFDGIWRDAHPDDVSYRAQSIRVRFFFQAEDGIRDRSRHSC